MKFTEQDFGYEALHQGKLLDYSGYRVMWSTTKDNGFIKFTKNNISMEDEVRFNIKTGRQITVNNSKATINKEVLDVVFSILNSLSTKVGCQVVTLLDSAVVHINNSHINELDWEKVDREKFKKFILAPKKGE